MSIPVRKETLGSNSMTQFGRQYCKYEFENRTTTRNQRITW